MIAYLIRPALALLLAATLSASAFAQSNTSTGAGTAAPLTPATETEASPEGLAAWEQVFAVFGHPRCVNCHTADEHPRWSGPHYGESARLHAMNVKRGEDGFGNPGLRCTTCHGENNSAKLHGPPGAETWHLAPTEMVWWERSSAQVCAQIKDPQRNGDRTLEEIAVHVRDDPLVGWGWAPGPGREPAPGSAEETYQALIKWTREGAPCPEQ